MTWTDELEKGIGHLRQSDKVLQRIIRAYPKPNFTPHTNYYQELVESIISQQLSVKAAASILKKFIASFGHFPTPDEILSRNTEDLRACGLSTQKSRYIHDLATHVRTGAITFANFPAMSNQEITSELTAVKGIGEWTAHMFLMFSLGRLDILPTGDLGIRNGVGKLYGLEHVTPQDVKNIAEKNHWQPYESIASWYIWASLDNKPIVSTDID